MNTFAKFFFTGSLALLAAAGSSFAADSDPGYSLGTGDSGSTSVRGGGGNRSANRYAPQYLRPTQRYYGKGYTVAYRFVPWSDRMRAINSTSTWDSEQTRLPANAAAATSTNGQSPRVTYFHQKPSASTNAFPARNSDLATTPKPLPPIGEAPAKK